MGKITINGVTYHGNSISVTGNRVLIDGVEQHQASGKTVKLIVEGDVEIVDCSDLEVHGDILGDVDATNVKCRAINGNVDATNVTSEYIGGKVDAVNVTHRT